MESSQIEVCLVPYRNEDKTITRWNRDILPALPNDFTVSCVDNSETSSDSLRKLFGEHYEWMGGRNLFYGGAINRVVARSKSQFILYCCTEHGLMLDRSWVNDILEPLKTDPKVAMAGCICGCHAPEEIGATEFAGLGMPKTHVQGGVFAARVEVMQKHLYRQPFLHLYSDMIVSWSLIQGGWKLAHVPTIKSVWRSKVETTDGFKYIHDCR